MNHKFFSFDEKSEFGSHVGAAQTFKAIARDS
jgi:hypothetical protein